MDNKQTLTEAQALGRIGNFFYNATDNTVTWSDELYRIMGIPLGEKMTFESSVELYVDSDRKLLIQLSEEGLKTGQGFETEASFIKRNETDVHHLFLRAKIIKDAVGKPNGIKGIVQDITDRKITEFQIQNLNKELIAKNRELASLHSELQTFNDIAANDYQETLKTLYTNLEFLISNDAKNLSSSGKAGIRKAQTAIQKMKLLTDDIISFSQIQQLENEKSEVDLNRVVSGVIHDIGEKIKNNHVNFELAELPTIQGFPLLLSLLFHHLLDNAIKFRNPERPLVIKIGYEITRNDQSASNTPYHRIMVSDNGIGFDEKQAQKIFTIFQKLHEKKQYKGSGIGLAVCKKIMALHDGIIVGESHGDKGSDFCCFFPL